MRKKTRARIEKLERAIERTPRGWQLDRALDKRFERANLASLEDRIHVVETRRWVSRDEVERLKRDLLTHHETVWVNDTNEQGGHRVLSRLDVMRGRTPQGKPIHTIRQAGALAEEFHVEGRAMPTRSSVDG